MKRAFICYLVALHAAFAFVAVKIDLPGKIAVRLGLSHPDRPVIAWMRYVHRQMDPTVPSGAVLFLGDSLTQYLPTAAVFPNSVNFGISGQRTDQLIISMDRYESMSRASRVIVTIGTNDVLQDKTEGIESRYRDILSKIPAGVPVVLAGIPSISGKDVGPVVESAGNACQQDARCTFVNLGSLDLKEDGIHLTPKGYAQFAERLHSSGV